jgi:hypothetical protein
MNESAEILIIGVATKLNEDWSRHFPEEPEPHSWHFMPNKRWCLEFWEEPGEKVKKALEGSICDYKVTKKVGKLRLKPLT